jgi:hypothetical protein
VCPREVAFQVCDKFTRGQSRPFLDADPVGVEERQIRGDDDPFGAVALLYLYQTDMNVRFVVARIPNT